MAQSGYDAISMSEADFYDGPATLSDYMTRLIAANTVGSVPTFLVSKCARLDRSILFDFHISIISI